MTDREAVGPALSPEEWGPPEMGRDNRDGDTFFAYVGKARVRRGVEVGDLVVGWNGEPMRTLLPTQRHALAALCLHGQPFGFGREDVEALREVLLGDEVYEHTDHCGAAEENGGGDCDCGSRDRRTRLESLAARIEALLPPEGT